MKLSGNLDLDFGQAQNTREHTYTALPVYVPANDAGRVIYVSNGTDIGYWFGNADGSGAWVKITFGTTLASWAVTGESILDGVTDSLTLVSSGVNPPQAGFITKVTLASNLASGFVTVQIFNDTGRTDKIYEATFDLSSGLLTDRIPTYFDVDNDTGTIYPSIINNTGSTGTFDLSIDGVGVQLVPNAPPPGSGSGVNAGVAGDGLDYNVVSAQLEVLLSATPGLELVGSAGDRTLRVKTDPSGGLARAGAGLQVDSTVLKTTGTQVITGSKSFSQFRLTPAGSPGAPVAGTHQAGELYMDSNLDVWECTTGGTPGTWVFFGNKLAQHVAGPATLNYVGNVLAMNNLDAEISLRGRRGNILKFNVWGADPVFAASNISVPFRVAAYLDEGFEERDRVWTVSGTLKKTYLTVNANAGTSILTVSDLSVAAPDDLLRIRKGSTPVEEYGRIQTETVSWGLFETLVNSVVINDNIMYVNEFKSLPWINTSATPANYEKLYLKFFNDHAAQTVIFGYEIFVESHGGGMPL